MRTLGHLGARYFDLDDVEHAVLAYAEAEAIFQELEREEYPPNPDLGTMAIMALRRAEIAMAQGRYGDAKIHANDSVRHYEAAGNRWSKVNPLILTGSACLQLGQYDQGRRHFLDAQLIADEWGHPWAMAETRYFLSVADLKTGNLMRALEYCRESLEVALSAPDYNIVAGDLGVAAAIWAKHGQADRTARLSGAAQVLYKRQGRNPRVDCSLVTLLPGWQDGPDQEAIAAAFEAGKTMSVEQAVAFALG